MVFTVLLSVTVLRKRYSLVQYLSVALVMSGLILVTMVDIWRINAAKKAGEPIEEGN